MAIADLTTYKSVMAGGGYQEIDVFKASVVGAAGLPGSYWTSAGSTGTGVAPTTAVVPTSATVGAVPFVNPVSADSLYLVQIEGRATVGAGFLWLCDRLSHQGGLSGTVTTAQSTNLPTAALTRYTSGVGVMAAVEIYTALGTTATTFTASYTNQAGTTGRTSAAAVIGGASPAADARRLIPFNVQNGDIGVRAVANVTVLASTLTAGNFGVTLFKPLLGIPLHNMPDGIWYDGMLSGRTVQIINDACLFFVATGFTGNFNNLFFRMTFVEV